VFHLAVPWYRILLCIIPQLIDKIILIDPVYSFGKIDDPEIIANYKLAIDHENRRQVSWMILNTRNNFRVG
jgi:hypothetical protein